MKSSRKISRDGEIEGDGRGVFKCFEFMKRDVGGE